ncbi:MAG: Mur ligase family protein [Candidatus Absconditabacteria bacterium]
MGNIVLVGGGGTGMSGVAGILHDLGYTNLICIDANQSQLTDNLKKKGIKVIIGHGKYEITIKDAVIYSEAVANSVEVLEARKLITKHQLMMLSMNYFQFLGEISKYFTTIGITGTNGKSSTTALAIYAAQDIPQFGLGILGALVPDFNNQSYLINPDHKAEIKGIFDHIFTGKPKANIDGKMKELVFIVEACEYKRHFLNLDLDYAAITSMEFDHADYYKDFDDYKSAFTELLTKLRHKAIVLNGFLERFPEFLPYADKIEEIQEESHHFEHIFGPHVNKNASLCDKLISKIQPKFTIQHSKDFTGLRRRLEYLGKTNNGTRLFSDYGHMASSIGFGFEALKSKFPETKLTVIFQPHQITRMFTGRDDFVASFKGYDKVIIYDIYAARENLSDFDFSRRGNNIHNIEELGNVFAKACGGTYTDQRSDIETVISTTPKDEIIVIYSAGDIDYEVRTKISLKKD